MKSPDCIENKIVLQAPRARVWRAITDAEEFGMWFPVRLARPSVEGATAVGSGFDGLPEATRRRSA
jgi:uncharacterized protein YndB with AHSA1/START domain